ncbi:MAG: tRNA lysidine(34) synthetase TilS [Ruminococcus sp.]|nr:tRNA lysidine(34) synthetase TilS [Ruminococcus sp.]
MITDFFDRRVMETIERYKMADKSECLLVGLSGGADSTSLLLCLKALGFRVKACHVNHCIRGEESDRDEEFCARLCERIGVELTAVRIDVPAYCETHSCSVEEGARKLRYEALESIECDKICTAHNLDDNLETAIFNMARGSGIAGLCGIPPVRGRIIRPLIETGREEIEEYLKALGQEYVTDSTNLTDEYTRNKIRHNIIPVMKGINPALMRTYRANARQLREDMELIDRIAEERLAAAFSEGGYLREKLIGEPEALRRRMIAKIIAESGAELSARAVKDAENILINGGKINIKGELFLVCDHGSFRTVRMSGKTEGNAALAVPEKGELWYMGRRVSFEIEKNDGGYENVHKKFANSCLDYDKIIGGLVLRQRAAGDRIKLVGREHSSDVRMLLKQAFRAEDRAGAVILADDEGIVLVEGFGAADRVKIDESTKRVLLVGINGGE